MTKIIDKWEKPISKWTDDEKKEFNDYQKLHHIWLSSGIWRKTSFEDFVKKLIEIKKHGH